MEQRPRISFILATHNRRSVVVETLAHIKDCGLDASDFEIVVVDNASTDGTSDAITSEVDLLIRLGHNAGSCGKSLGVERARGSLIVFLDDDSYPQPGSIARMIDHFSHDARLGAAGFAVHLPDGSQEGAALPHVFVGCGVGFRTEALREAGGPDGTFFMQAEEYDLAFRLAQRGWTVETFPDIHVNHQKSAQARRSERTTYYDIRNNLRVAARYLPKAALCAYRQDWLQRYRWLAETPAHRHAFADGVRGGRRLGFIERRTGRRLSPPVFERFFQWNYLERQMRDIPAQRIVFADLGKNIYAYHRAAQAVGIEVLAIGDDRFAGRDRSYRGDSILPLDEALTLPADAVVVANSSEIHGTATYAKLKNRCRKDIYHWFKTPCVSAFAQLDSAKVLRSTDDKLTGQGVMALG